MKFEMYCGDVIEQLRKLPDKIVNTCVTSPPYYGLRDYGTGTWIGGDPNCKHYRQNKASSTGSTGHVSMMESDQAMGDAIYKTVCPICGAVRVDNQIGLEGSPDEYIDKLVQVFREVKRVLRDDGILWVNIGDSYNASGHGRKADGSIEFSSKSTKQTTNNGSYAGVHKKTVVDNCKPKDLIGIPWMLAFALRADGWYLRQDIIWAKNNPMPESVKDRCTRSHEYIFMLTKNRKYYFDHEAMQESTVTYDQNKRDRDHTKLNNTPGRTRMAGLTRNDYKTRNKRDVWSENDEKKQPRFGGSKYGDSDDPKFQCYSGNEYKPTGMRNKRDVWRESVAITKEAHFAVFPKKLIEPCILAGCPEDGIVLDCFSGSGTTGIVAVNNNRNYIGIELNPEYIKITERRVEKECTNVSIVENGQ